jgi:hypothetical protein
MKPNPIRVVSLVLLGIALTGCVNLKAVREFATASTEDATLKAIAGEMVDSPRRKVRYAADDDTKKAFEAAAAVGRTKRAELVRSHEVIRAYMATLATLAGGGTVEPNSSVAGFTAEVGDSSLLNASEQQAFGKLATLVSHAATDSYRRTTVRQMIRQSASDFPAAIAALQRAVRLIGDEQLGGEVGALNQYYRIQSNLPDPTTPAWARVLVEEIRQDREAGVQQKIEVCRNYATALGRIADGHAAMLKNLDHLDAQELVVLLKQYEQEIAAAYEAIKRL